jgi:hypothetical protein
MRANKRQSKIVALRCTPGELQELENAARETKVSVSEDIRQKLGIRKES